MLDSLNRKRLASSKVGALSPATMSEGGAFMRPTPPERLIRGKVWKEIVKDATGDREPNAIN